MEWVGGYREFLVPVDEHGERLAIALWVSEGKTLTVEPTDRASMKRAFIEALKRAIASEGRRPTSVRVATNDEAARVRAVLGSCVAVRVARVPELDVVFDELLRNLAAVAEANRERTGGPLPHPFEELVVLAHDVPDAVARHFQRAAALYPHAPWDIIPTDSDVLVIEAPSLPWKRRCVTVVGQNGEVYGFMAFASVESLARFRRGARNHADVGSGYMVLEYDPVADMPPPMRRELTRRRWTLADPAAIPLLMRMTSDHKPAPIRPVDVEEAVALSTALAAFFMEHERAMETDPYTARRGAYVVDGAAVTVRYTGIEELLAEDGGDQNLADDLDLEFETGALLRAWNEEFADRFPKEVAAAREELAVARLGRKATRKEENSDDLLATSLPTTWAAFFRPMRDGKTGLELLAAEEDYDDPGAVAARKRFEGGRLLFGEVLGVDLDAEVAIVRDHLDGQRYRVFGTKREQLRQYNRWMLVLGVVLPGEDGRWSFPSVFSAVGTLSDLRVEDFITRVRETVGALGRPLVATEGEALRAALLREAGVVHGVFARYLDEFAAKPPMKRFLSNTDDECIEFTEAVVSLKLPVKVVAATFASAEDFSQTGSQCWDRIDRTRTIATPHGETMGQLEREGSRWVVRGNSTGRVERMLDRLGQLFGERPSVSSRTVTAPWKTDANVVRTKAEAGQFLQIANGPIGANESEARASMSELPIVTLRRMLDVPNEAAGGTHRERVSTAEGREAVEKWLRGAEGHGSPPNAGESRLLDLDPLRRELGLPTVL